MLTSKSLSVAGIFQLAETKSLLPEVLIFTLFSGFNQKIVASLKGKHRNLHVATSSDSEDLLELHYSFNRRIAPIVLSAEPGWLIATNKTHFSSGGEFTSWILIHDLIDR